MDGLLPIVATLTAFAVTALLGLIFIPYLHKLKYGQTILDIGPNWHKSKQGTPTMGGVMFIIGIVVAAAVTVVLALVEGSSGFAAEITSTSPQKRIYLVRIFAGLLMALSFAVVGFIDDYIKVVKKRNLGLTARQKTLLQLLIAAAYLTTLALQGDTFTDLPFIGRIDCSSGVGLLYWPIALFFIYGFVNAVNLTDGIDGLCSSVTAVVSAFFMLSSGVLKLYGLNILSAVCVGGCAGFLIWNAHPAKVFMGDTGSLFFGGMVVAMAFGSGMPVILLIAGIVYVIEALSVVLQVTYYKRTKKRIFKMTPIHHHFEMSGWGENKIVVVFSLITLIGCLLAGLCLFSNYLL